MEFSGAIFFNVDSEAFEYYDNSNEEVYQILRMKWYESLRYNVAKINIDGTIIKGKSFSRICRTSNVKGIEKFVRSLNETFRWEVDQDPDTFFASENAYRSMIEQNPIDIEVEEELPEEDTKETFVTKMEFSGAIFFNVDSEAFEYYDNSNEEVSHLLGVKWYDSLRYSVAKISIDGANIKGKSFSRICKTSNDKGIDEFVDNLNETFRREVEQDPDTFFAIENAYRSMVEQNPVDIEVEEGMEVDKNEVYVTKMKLTRALEETKKSFSQEVRKSNKKFTKLLLEKMDQIRDEFAKKSPEKKIKLENDHESDIENFSIPEDNRTLSTEGSNQNGLKNFEIIKRLPFNDDAEIDDFFSSGENTLLLYDTMKNYFSTVKGVAKGMKRLLSEDYLLNHVWGGPMARRNSTNSPECNQTLKLWLRNCFIIPFADANPTKRGKFTMRISNSFSETRRYNKTKKEIEPKFVPQPKTEAIISQPLTRHEVIMMLPFKNDAQIDAFFTSEENSNVLYGVMENYFKTSETVKLGVRKLVTREYARNHIWYRGSWANNRPRKRPPCNKNLKEWIETAFIQPLKTQDPEEGQLFEKKISRQFEFDKRDKRFHS